MSNILEIKDLVVSYGGIEAVKGISMEVPEGQIITLIGANGAGKSTTLKSISGIVKPKSASILFNGEEICGKTPDYIVSKGITLVPEGRRVFSNLTVAENLKIGAYLRKDNIKADMDYVYSLFPRLKEREWQLSGTLSGGEQQRVSIARALAKRPKLLLCDEPTGALDYETGKSVLKLLQDTCRDTQMTVLLITHNQAITPMADRVITMKNGKIAAMQQNAKPVPVSEIAW